MYCPNLFFLWSTPLLAFAASPLQVRLPTGTFLGTTSAGIDKWLGIRYGQAPVGDLRFKAPVPVPASENGLVVNASTFGNACPQASSNLGAPMAEDCLFLNVFRPQGTSTSAGLPVLVWIHGGAYTNGAASQPQYDPTAFIQRSVTINKPIVFVSINYRVNTFGFLSSAFVPPEDLNAGLHDQRLALQFVQDNIAAFGGDPSKVTIWGQSAGAGSVEAHVIFPPPDRRRLFRAALAESSTGPFKTSPPASTYDQPGKPLARLLSLVGCPAPGPGAVDCLRKVEFETLLNTSNTLITSTLNNQLWQPSVGPPESFMPERASTRIQRGDFLRVPWLSGTNVNEGNGFSTTLIPLNPSSSSPPSTSNTLFNTFIANLLITGNSTLTPRVLSRLDALFPAGDPSLGAPFNTGIELFDRGAAWYTDQMFLGPRRLWFDARSKVQEGGLWGYYFREFIPGNNVTLGVAHASELQLLFGVTSTVSIPKVEQAFEERLKDYWIRFVVDLDPGDWPQYTPKGRGILQLKKENVTVIPDNWDIEKTNFINSQVVLDEFEK